MLKLGDEHRGLQGQRCSGSDPGPTKALALTERSQSTDSPSQGRAISLHPRETDSVWPCLRWVPASAPIKCVQVVRGLSQKMAPVDHGWAYCLESVVGTLLALPLGLAWPAGLPGKVA